MGKIPTCALSTPSVSLLCQRTYSLQDESEERELKPSLLVAPLQILNKSSPPPFTRNIIFHTSQLFVYLQMKRNLRHFKFRIFHTRKVQCAAIVIGKKMCSTSAARLHVQPYFILD